MTVAADYGSLNNIECHVATIGFQRDLAAVVDCLPDVSEHSSSHRVTTDGLEVLEAEQTTGRWHEWLEYTALASRGKSDTTWRSEHFPYKGLGDYP